MGVDQQRFTLWGNGWKRPRVCATKTWQSLCQMSGWPAGTGPLRFCLKHCTRVFSSTADDLTHCNKMLPAFQPEPGATAASKGLHELFEERLRNVFPEHTFPEMKSPSAPDLVSWQPISSCTVPTSVFQFPRTHPSSLCCQLKLSFSTQLQSAAMKDGVVTSGPLFLFCSTCVNIAGSRKGNNQDLWSVWSILCGKRRQFIADQLKKTSERNQAVENVSNNFTFKGQNVKPIKLHVCKPGGRCLQGIVKNDTLHLLCFSAWWLHVRVDNVWHKPSWP